MKILRVDVEGIIGTIRIDVVERSGVPSGHAVQEAREQAVKAYNQRLEDGKKDTKAGTNVEFTAIDDHLVLERKQG